MNAKTIVSIEPGIRLRGSTVSDGQSVMDDPGTESDPRTSRDPLAKIPEVTLVLNLDLHFQKKISIF